MANNPKFNFYVNDFEGGTRHMTDEEFGCYMRLLIAQFNRGGKLPNDTGFLSRYCDSFKKSWKVVQEKFKTLEDGQLQNERMETERVKSEDYSKSRKENFSKGIHMNKHMKPHMSKHMGNGKGNGIVDSVLRGIKFSENNEEVVFEDGSKQKLGESQVFMLAQQQLRPRDVFKGNSY